MSTGFGLYGVPLAMWRPLLIGRRAVDSGYLSPCGRRCDRSLCIVRIGRVRVSPTQRFQRVYTDFAHKARTNANRTIGLRTLGAVGMLVMLTLAPVGAIAYRSSPLIVGPTPGSQSVPGPSSGNQSVPGPSPEYSSWQQAVTSLPVPSAGCFEASYPTIDWVSGGSDCTTPPSVPLTVGNAVDYQAYVGSNTAFIDEAQGYVSPMTGFTSESDSVQGANYYSIQDNSNLFSATYNGQGVTAWEQFVFVNDPGASPPAGYVFIQYWLIDYLFPYTLNLACPSTHTYLTAWTSSGFDCWANSAQSFTTPLENPSSLGNYQFKGYANDNGNDESVFCDLTICYATAVAFNVFNLLAGWHYSEWNVFGAGGDSGACFNASGNPCPKPSGSPSLTVYQYLYGLGSIVASCASGGTTGETNNLNLGSCYSYSSSPTYYIYLSET